MRRLDDGREAQLPRAAGHDQPQHREPALLDFYFGGLNSQIEHHLFPRVPHHRYRAMRPIVRAFCRERGIAYEEATFVRALASVGSAPRRDDGRVRRVSLSARIFRA